MSLYNHVSGKADLLDGIASRVFESIAVPDAALPWDERVRALIGGCYEALRAHPAVVQALVAEAANPRSARPICTAPSPRSWRPTAWLISALNSIC